MLDNCRAGGPFLRKKWPSSDEREWLAQLLFVFDSARTAGARDRGMRPEEGDGIVRAGRTRLSVIDPSLGGWSVAPHSRASEATLLLED
jgi:hypothetical protein